MQERIDSQASEVGQTGGGWDGAGECVAGEVSAR